MFSLYKMKMGNKKSREEAHKEEMVEWQDFLRTKDNEKEKMLAKIRESIAKISCHKHQVLIQKPTPVINNLERIKENVQEVTSWDFKILEKFVPIEFVPLVQMCKSFLERIEENKRSEFITASDIGFLHIQTYQIIHEYLSLITPCLEVKNRQVVLDDLSTTLSRFFTKNMVIKDLTREYLSVVASEDTKVYYDLFIAPLVAFVNSRIYSCIIKIINEKFMTPFPTYFAEEVKNKSGIFSSERIIEQTAEKLDEARNRMIEVRRREKELDKREQEIKKREKGLQKEAEEKEEQTDIRGVEEEE